MCCGVDTDGVSREWSLGRAMPTTLREMVVRASRGSLGKVRLWKRDVAKSGEYHTANS